MQTRDPSPDALAIVILLGLWHGEVEWTVAVYGLKGLGVAVTGDRLRSLHDLIGRGRVQPRNPDLSRTLKTIYEWDDERIAIAIRDARECDLLTEDQQAN